MGSDGAGQGDLAAAIAVGGKVLHGPAGEIDRGIGGVIKLDEIIGKARALVSATAVDLRDDRGGIIRGGHGGRNRDG